MNWHWRPYALVLFTLLLPLLSCTQSPTSPPQSEFPLQPSELPPPSHPCHDIYLQLLRESSTLSSHKLFNALAVCYHQLDLLPQALKLYEHSILTSNNTFALPFANLAAVALNNGDHVTANALVREYLRGVGFNGSEPEFDDDAIEFGSPCTKGADKDGECCMALNNLGAGLLTGGHWTEAEEVLKVAVHIMGNDHVMGDKVFFNLGSVYAEECSMEEAAIAFATSFLYSFKANPDLSDPSALMRIALLVPPVSNSSSEIMKIRKLFEQRVRAIVHMADFGCEGIEDGVLKDLLVIEELYELRKTIRPLKNRISDPSKGLQTPHFYLHYHGAFDRPIQELVASMHILLGPTDLLVPSSPMIHPSGRLDGFGSRKKRICFISSLFGEGEPHGLLLQDVISNIDNRYYDVYVVVIGGEQAGDMINKSAYDVIAVGYDWRLARRTLNELQLDALVFAEMQNEAMSHMLGFGRFAPVQILAMGSPVTSGNPSIDYFVSCSRSEHPLLTMLDESESHYSEQLVLLEGLGISYPRPFHLPQAAHLSSPERDKIWLVDLLLPSKFLHFRKYTCPQHLFKLHPDFDAVISGMLAGDEGGVVLLQSAESGRKTGMVRRRISRHVVQDFGEKAGSDFLKRLVFIPRVTSDVFHVLLQMSSVLLHPFPFGGSKTSSDAILSGTPLVTLPTPYLRGRMVLAQYFEIMDDVQVYDCCVAASVTDYIYKALRLGINDALRYGVKELIGRGAGKIFDNESVRLEWLAFLDSVLKKPPELPLQDPLKFSRHDSEVLQNLQRRWIEDTQVSVHD